MGGKYKPVFILLHNLPKEEKCQTNSLIFLTTADRRASPKLSEGDRRLGGAKMDSQFIRRLIII